MVSGRNGHSRCSLREQDVCSRSEQRLSTNLAIAVLCSCWLAAAAAAAADLSEPFVSGYDRFVSDEDDSLGAAGSLLLSELSCTACHATQEDQLQPKRGPRLDGVADRLQAAWIRRFLMDPQSVKPGTTMPQPLAALSPPDRSAAVDALVAYLSTLHDDTQFQFNSTASVPLVPQFWNWGDPQRGQRLYHQVGCVACHAPDEKYQSEKTHQTDREQLLARLDLTADELAELGLAEALQPVRSVPHAQLSAKYDRRSLTFFLLDPLKTRPSGRMPNMKLQAEEAADIVAYLVPTETPPATTELPPGDVSQRGRQLFGDLGCANCHEAKGAPPQNQPNRLMTLDANASRHCFGERPHRGLPYYRLGTRQRQAVRQVLRRIQTDPADDHNNDPQQRLRSAMLQLNCYGCHERGKRGGVGPQRRRYFETTSRVDMGDEGRMPPPLDGAGRKFKEAWLTQVLGGSGDVRPYMRARMPIFGSANVGQLHQDFAAVDRTEKPNERDMLRDVDGGAEAGRILLGAGCVQCHPLRGEALAGVVGIDLAEVERRLQSQWFHEFLINPAVLKPRTRMPTFFAGGKSPSPEILEGDVQRQIAAMWRYLNDLQNQPLPANLARGKAYDFVLTPQDRPLILRTFMKTAGTHAIAVGFSQQVHVAFDAEQVRLAEAWRGRFLDAHGTWFDRFTPLAQPLGDAVIRFPSGMPLAKLAAASSPWPQAMGEAAGYRFSGYRLDAKGVPTFLYEFDNLSVEDRIVPSSDGAGLMRQLQIGSRDGDTKPATDIWFRVAVGETIQRESDVTCKINSRLTVTVAESVGPRSELRRANGRSEWIIPLRIEGQQTLDLRYQWNK